MNLPPVVSDLSARPRFIPAAVSLPAILARICVRPPYFALSELCVRPDGTLTAGVMPELDPGPEAHPIALAEAGRHLAILGSCAAALRSPDAGRTFYLAVRAEGSWFAPPLTAERAGPLFASATAMFPDRRSARAETALHAADGSPLMSLTVDYKVLPEAAFHRIFRVQSTPAAAERVAGPSPFHAALPLVEWRRAGEHMHARLPSVGPELCAGHFPELPALPVAVVAGGMLQVAQQLLRELVGADPLRCIAGEASLAAQELALAGETIDFTARCTGQRGRVYTFEGAARAGERTIAELKIAYTWL